MRRFQWTVIRSFTLVLRTIREQSRGMHLHLLALERRLMAQVDDLIAELVKANEKTDAIALQLEEDSLKLTDASGDIDQLIAIVQAGGTDLSGAITLA